MEQTTPLQLTQRHTDILLLLYRFRYLTRPQIQTLLHYKNHRQTIELLNKLTAHDHVRKYYDQKSAIVPAMYSLGKSSRAVLKKLGKPSSELKRIRWEKNYTPTFRDRCVTVAQIYLDLMQQTGGALRFWTKADLNGVENLIAPAPDAYFIVKAKRYFLDALITAPSKALCNRVRKYADYYTDGEWREEEDTIFPKVIILCSNPRSAKSLSYYIKKELSDEPDLHFVVSSDRTLEKILPKKKA